MTRLLFVTFCLKQKSLLEENDTVVGWKGNLSRDDRYLHTSAGAS